MESIADEVDDEKAGALEDSARRDRLWVSLITGGAAALGLHRLGRISLWFDEGLTVAVAGAPIAKLLGLLEPSGGNMALYYVLMWPWTRLGQSEWALRLPSLVFGVATVPVLYLLGRRLAGRRAALIAAIFFVFSGTFVRYAQEARSYTMVMLLLTLAWLALAGAVERPSTQRWVLWFVAAVAAMYTHLIAVLFVGAQCLSLALLPRGTVRARGFATAAVVVAPLLLPLVALVRSPEASVPAWIPPLYVSQVLDSAGAATGALGARPYLAAVGVVLVVASGTALRVLLDRGRSLAAWRAALPVVWVVLPLAAATMVSLFNPLMIARFYSPAAPGAALAIGMVLARQRRARPALAALPLIVLALPAVTLSYVRQDQEDWRSAARFVTSNGTPDDAIAFFSHEGRATFEYYVDRFGAEGTAPQPLYPAGEWRGARRTYPLPALPAVLDALAGREEVWLVVDVRARTLGPEGAFDTTVATLEGSHGSPQRESFHGGLHVLLYRQRSTPAAVEQRGADSRFAGEVEFTGSIRVTRWQRPG